MQFLEFSRNGNIKLPRKMKLNKCVICQEKSKEQTMWPFLFYSGVEEEEEGIDAT